MVFVSERETEISFAKEDQCSKSATMRGCSMLCEASWLVALRGRADWIDWHVKPFEDHGFAVLLLAL